MNTKKFFGYGTRSLFRAIILMVGVMLVFSFTACDNGNGDDGFNTPSTPEPFNDITAAALVSNIRVGWNLGNSLDVPSELPSVTQMETGWGNPVTKKALITAVKKAGFNAIRIPVSWTKAVGGAPDYTIRTDWMRRVTEVVNYAVENDMYIILNTHHDDVVFKFTNAEIDTSLTMFQKIWAQIAGNFKNYNEKLIFEGLNEPRTEDGVDEWWGGTADERTNLNKYYRVFVQTVRESGGNNDKRILMINPYAAWPTPAGIDGLILPNDTAANKYIVSIHSYMPHGFCFGGGTKNWSSTNSSDTKPIHDAIMLAYNKFVSQGVPVIIGEFGAESKDNEDARAAWAEYHVRYAKDKGIACFWWDGGVGVGGNEYKIIDRDNNKFVWPKIKDALMRGSAPSN
jgi:endoglucanase